MNFRLHSVVSPHLYYSNILSLQTCSKWCERIYHAYLVISSLLGPTQWLHGCAQLKSSNQQYKPKSWREFGLQTYVRTLWNLDPCAFPSRTENARRGKHELALAHNILCRAREENCTSTWRSNAKKFRPTEVSEGKGSGFRQRTVCFM